MAIFSSGMTTSLQTLMTQFRARYPMGSLLSEFQTVHDGLFVVRAIAQIGGATLSSGLAAEPTIEQAEDRAKVRAIEALGIQSFMPSLSGATGGVKLSATLPDPSSPELDVGFEPAAIAQHPPAESSSPLNTSPLPPIVDPVASAALAVAPPPSFTDEPLPETNDIPEFHPPAKEVRRKATAEIEPPSEVSVTPMDLSDVIAQTSVELKRLGWSEPQGRKHLQQTYNKRSRQQLTDDELLDFLKYLQTQPSP